nr:hypothetical protein [Tanacetum cinerariifolium]
MGVSEEKKVFSREFLGHLAIFIADRIKPCENVSGKVRAVARILGFMDLELVSSDCVRCSSVKCVNYYILKELMSILRGWKSIPGISSSERENGKKEPMAWQTDYGIMKEGMSILRGRKSVPGINSHERGKWKEKTTLSSREGSSSSHEGDLSMESGDWRVQLCMGHNKGWEEAASTLFWSLRGGLVFNNCVDESANIGHLLCKPWSSFMNMSCIVRTYGSPSSISSRKRCKRKLVREFDDTFRMSIGHRKKSANEVNGDMRAINGDMPLYESPTATCSQKMSSKIPIQLLGPFFLRTIWLVRLLKTLHVYHLTVQNSYGTPRESRRESVEAMSTRRSERPQKGRRRFIRISKEIVSEKPEWSRYVTIVHQTKDLHTPDYTQLYDFLKYNQKEVDELKAERIAKIQDPLALMANSNNPYASPAPHQDQSPFNQSFLQQPMTNLEDITDPTTAMNMALALMAKAFKLNFSTPTNNNQRISSNPRNRQTAQPSMNMGQDRQMQMIGGNGENQFRQYAGQTAGNLNGYNEVQNVGNQVAQNPRIQNIGNKNGLIGVQGNGIQNQIGTGNLVAVRAEGNAA